MNTPMADDMDIKVAARDWVMRLSLDEPSATDRAQFDHWCEEDVQHRAAYERFQSIWEDAATLHELAPLADLPESSESWLQRLGNSLRLHRPVWAGCTAMLGVVVVFGIWRLTPPTHFVTGVAEVRTIQLIDGSEVTLGARSALDVSFRAAERRVALTAGEAFFSVSKNPQRPFVVVVGDKEVRVVGTKFEVRRTPGTVHVAVVEGTVVVMPTPGHQASAQSSRRVRTAAGDERSSGVELSAGAGADIPNDGATPNVETRVLTAGQQVTAAMAGVISEPAPMPRGEPAAWRHGRLEYVDAPLKDIVADASRYSSESIVIGDKQLADVRVSVTYRSDRVPEMLSALSQSLTIDVERASSGGIVLLPHERVE